MPPTDRSGAFLLDIGMHPSLTDMDECTSRFVSQMRSGLFSERSSLMMMPTYFSADAPIEKGQRVIVLDAGGTNFRTALAEINDSSIKIRKMNTSPMPGSLAPISMDELLDEI